MNERIELLLDVLAAHLCTETDGDIALFEALGDHLLDADERTADDE